MKQIGIIIILSFFIACTHEKIRPEDIVGEWEVVDFKMDPLPIYSEISPEQIEESREMVLGEQYHINADSQIMIKNTVGEIYKQGKWRLSIEDSTLSLQDTIGITVFTIGTLDKKHLTFVNKSFGEATLFLEKR